MNKLTFAFFCVLSVIGLNTYGTPDSKNLVTDKSNSLITRIKNSFTSENISIAAICSLLGLVGTTIIQGTLDKEIIPFTFLRTAIAGSVSTFAFSSLIAQLNHLVEAEQELRKNIGPGQPVKVTDTLVHQSAISTIASFLMLLNVIPVLYIGKC